MDTADNACQLRRRNLTYSRLNCLMETRLVVFYDSYWFQPRSTGLDTVILSLKEVDSVAR